MPAHPGASHDPPVLDSLSVRALLLAVAIAASAAALGFVATRSPTSPNTTTVVREVAIAPIARRSNTSFTVAGIYSEAARGVVDIKVTTTTKSGPFGLGGSQRVKDEGAGVVFDARGDVLTDEHVLGSASSATVTFENGTTARAWVVGTDASTDVGVIRVRVPVRLLHPIPFANSARLRVGDPVVAIGSPFGLPETVTSGIVSAVGRSIPAPNGYTILGAIQTDAAINPGNSGGPLLDGRGRVIGLADQIATGGNPFGEAQSSGVGFATPANTVANVANLLITGKPVPHAYIGVSLDPGVAGGAEIAAVRSGSPAARAGLEQGDVITAFDGHGIGSAEQLIEKADSYSPGQRVRLTVERGKRTLTIELTLAARPKTTAGSSG
jgi:putative serine protease PepD